MLPAISQEILVRLMQGDPVKSVEVSASGSDFAYQFG
jgi:hypothetical protein